MAATILTVTELAENLNTTPRVTRKFLRSVTEKENQPGKGGRWQIKKADVRSLTKKFKDFEAKMRQAETVDASDDED